MWFSLWLLQHSNKEKAQTGKLWSYILCFSLLRYCVEAIEKKKEECFNPSLVRNGRKWTCITLSRSDWRFLLVGEKLSQLLILIALPEELKERRCNCRPMTHTGCVWNKAFKQGWLKMNVRVWRNHPTRARTWRSAAKWGENMLTVRRLEEQIVFVWQIKRDSWLFLTKYYYIIFRLLLSL